MQLDDIRAAMEHRLALDATVGTQGPRCYTCGRPTMLEACIDGAREPCCAGCRDRSEGYREQGREE